MSETPEAPPPGSLSYSQLKQENTPVAPKKGVMGKIARLAAVLGIIGAGTVGVGKGVETGASLAGSAIEQAGQLKDSISLTPAQRDALEKYTAVVKNNPELIKKDIVIYDPENKLQEINARNQHDINTPQSIIDKVKVGTYFKEAIIVTGQDPNSLPERPTESNWYFIPTKWNEGKPTDGMFVHSKYGRQQKPEEKNILATTASNSSKP